VYREDWTLIVGKEGRKGGSITESARLSTTSRSFGHRKGDITEKWESWYLAIGTE
jgi:hypothetical protein